MAQRKGGEKGTGLQSVLDLQGRDAPVLAGLQQRLGQLVGQSSGYLESLPKNVQDRVKALKHLHNKRSDLEKQFNKELEELEKKYEALYQPFYSRRSEIITGQSEPKPEELVEEEKEKKEETAAKTETPEAKDVKGVPEFWLQAFLHHDEFGACMTERDVEALKHLIDVKVAPNPESPHGFILEFHFADNEFFEDKILKKSYFLNESPADGEIMYDHVDCTKIKWKSGKNLCIKKVTKKQGAGPGGRKGKRGGRGGGGGGQTVTVEEPCPSFFNFFNPEVGFLLGLEGMEEEFEDEDMAMQEILEADYDMALELKEKVIPNAVMFFTGEVPQYILDDGEEEEDEEAEEEEEDEENDYKPPADQSGQQANPECKQQ